MISINSKYSIDSDSNQFRILEHRKATEKKPEHWVPIKFFVSFSACADAIRQRLIRESDYDSFAELERNAKAINKLIDKRVKAAI